MGTNSGISGADSQWPAWVKVPAQKDESLTQHPLPQSTLDVNADHTCTKAKSQVLHGCVPAQEHTQAHAQGLPRGMRGRKDRGSTTSKEHMQPGSLQGGRHFSQGREQASFPQGGSHSRAQGPLRVAAMPIGSEGHRKEPVRVAALQNTRRP